MFVLQCGGDERELLQAVTPLLPKVVMRVFCEGDLCRAI